MGKIKTGCLGFIGIIVVLGLVGSCMGGGSKDQTKSSSSSSTQTTTQEKAKEKVYANANIDVLLSEAKENAAAANKNYKDKDIKIEDAIVDNIESNADYVSLRGSEKITLLHVQAFVDKKDQATKDKILSLKKGQKITVYGHVKEVGEALGYRVSIDKIE
jgi:hypothetical protein